MPRVLITGATGFLGGAVARQLHGRGWDVVATGRNKLAGESLAAAGMAFYPCDLVAAPRSLRGMAKGCQAVIHCAALSSPWGKAKDFHQANVETTRHVLEACQENGISRLVHISSPSVLFDFRDQYDLTEDIVWTNPAANPYIASKRAAEEILCASDSVRAIILRPKGLIGPGDTTLVPRVVRVAKRGSFPIFRGHDPLLDLTTIDDAAHAVCLAVEAPANIEGKTYHVTSGQALPASTAFRALFAGCGMNPRPREVEISRAMRVAGWLEIFSRLVTGGRWEPPITRYSMGALAFTQTLSIAAIRRDLGYQPGDTQLADVLRSCGEDWRNRQNQAP